MHTSSTLVLVIAVFGASLVEMVEALTIVVAAGVSRGWRSAFLGAGAAAFVLGVLVGAVGVPLVRYVPIDTLRVVVGALLLVLGLGWLRKAILRSSGTRRSTTRTRSTPRRWPSWARIRARRVGVTTVWALPSPSRASSSKGPRWS